MSRADVEAALAEVREAGVRLREKSAGEVFALLGRWLDAWNAEDSQWRSRLVRELPDATGFTPETVSEGLRRALSPFGAKPLDELVERELGGVETLEGRGAFRVSGFETTAVLLAGSLPTPTLLSVLAPLVLRSAVVVKPSAHDPVTARVVAETLGEIDDTLGASVRVVPFASKDHQAVAALLEADCIVATGSDETIAAVAAQVRPPRRLVQIQYARRQVVMARSLRPPDGRGQKHRVPCRKSCFHLLCRPRRRRRRGPIRLRVVPGPVHGPAVAAGMTLCPLALSRFPLKAGEVS